MLSYVILRYYQSFFYHYYHKVLVDPLNTTSTSVKSIKEKEQISFSRKWWNFVGKKVNPFSFLINCTFEEGYWMDGQNTVRKNSLLLLSEILITGLLLWGKLYLIMGNAQKNKALVLNLKNLIWHAYLVVCHDPNCKIHISSIYPFCYSVYLKKQSCSFFQDCI